MATTKISIAIDEDALLHARRAAAAEGVSLSRYIGVALANQFDAQERLDAARELHATWGPETTPTAKDRAAFLALMRRPRRRRRRAA